MHSAQLDLGQKLAAQQAADKKHADDRPRWMRRRPAGHLPERVNKFAAAKYMGGRTDGMDAMLTAESPQGLIDKMAVQRVMADRDVHADGEFPGSRRSGRQG